VIYVYKILVDFMVFKLRGGLIVL